MAQTESPVVKFEVEGSEYELNIAELELGEIELLEEEFDRSLEEIDLMRTKAVRVLTYIAMSRKDSSVTMDRIRHLKIGDINFLDPVENGDGAPRPTTRAKRSKPAG